MIKNAISETIAFYKAYFGKITKLSAKEFSLKKMISCQFFQVGIFEF
jgi:hypothetical protein